MSKQISLYIHHILEAISEIECFYKEDNLQDRKTYLATLRLMQTMADSVKFIPTDYKEKHNLPWKQIIGFRNILVHDYLGEITPERIAEYITTDLPPLKDIIQKIQSELEQETL